MREILQDRFLPCIQINTCDLNIKYFFIDDGLESRVYCYDSETVIKIFIKATILKYSKIKLMATLENEFFVFPKGFVGFESGFKEGYFMARVNTQEGLENFSKLYFLDDLKRIIAILKQADRAIEWAHLNDILIGDIREKNILINKTDKPKFCDTDNYFYKDFDFDLTPKRIFWLSRLYGREFSLIEVDKFLYGLMCLKILTRDFTTIVTKSHIENLINNLNFSNRVKEGFRFVCSDTMNRPYMQEILSEMESDVKRFTITRL